MQSVWIKRVHIDSIQSKYDIDTRNQCTVQKPWSFYELAKTRQQPTKNHRSGWLILNVWCWTWQHCVAKEVRYKKSETVAELRRRVEEQLDLAASQARGSFGSGQGVKILGTWQLERFFAMFRIIGVMSVHVLMPSQWSKRKACRLINSNGEPLWDHVRLEDETAQGWARMKFFTRCSTSSIPPQQNSI